MLFLESAALVYVAVQSPFLIWAFYPLLKRLSWLASPEIVFPSISSMTAFFTLYYLYGHYAIAGGMIVISYALLRRLKYPDPESLAISVLTILAIDQIWQMPIHLHDWTASLLGFEIGIASAAWNFMAFPLIPYFMLKAKRKPSVKEISGPFLLIASLCSMWSFNGLFVNVPYVVVFPWFAFFLAFFISSKPEYPIAPPISRQGP